MLFIIQNINLILKKGINLFMTSINTIQILIQYSYKNKTYFIVSRDSQLYALCYENEKARLNLTHSEKDLVLKVFSSFLVDEKASVKVDNINIDNNEYIIFFDTKHNNYYWKNKIPELKNTPTVNTLLNLKYNNHNEVYYSTQNSSEKILSKKFIKKIIIFGCTVIIAFSAASMPLIPSSQSIRISYEENGKIIFNEDFFELSEEEKDSKYKEMLYDMQDSESSNSFLSNLFKQNIELHAEYNSQILKEAINQNPNLSSEEKDFLYNILPLLEEHKEYIDFNFATVRLNTLRFLYPQLNPGDISGEYDEFHNTVSFFNYDNKTISNFTQADKLTATHEIGHIFSPSSSGILHECSNEAWSRASIDKLNSENKISTRSISQNEDGTYSLKGGGYPGFMPFYYILTEFMTKEEILQYQYSGNINIIANALIRIEEQYESSNNIDKSKERAYSLLSKLDSRLDNQADIYLPNVSSYALKELDYYYRLKNGKSLYDNLNTFLIATNISLYEKSLEQNYLSYYTQNHISEKKKAFFKIVQEELIKKYNLNNNVVIDFDLFLISPPDVFFNNSNNSMHIYINKIPLNRNGEYPEEVSLDLEITEDIQKRFEVMCNEITNGIEK